MQDPLDKLLEEYATKQFFADLQQSVTTVKSQPAAWAEELQERQAWDYALEDGLEEEDAQDERE